MRLLSIFLALFILSSNSYAQDTDVQSGKYFLPHCKAIIESNKDNPFQMAVCIGVVIALMRLGPSLTTNISFCAPDSVTYAQAVKVIVSYLEAHPDTLHEDFVLLAHVALAEAWPCSK